MALYLVKAPTPEADQAEVHLKNAQAFVKGLVTAAGVGEDHPSARLRHLALKEAFYRRVGDLRRHAEVVEIMEVAAAEGAALALEKAAVKFNSGSFADARGLLDEAVIYLEHAGPHGASDLLRQAYRARSLCFHLDPTGDLPETWAEASRRKAAAFDPKALGYDWRRIEAALLAMDPPAEFTTVNDTLQFIKGRAPKPSAGSP
jgi:hypothetical protein